MKYKDDDPLIWILGEPGRREYAQREITKARKDHGLEPLELKERTCLKCDKSFQSEHKNNRMCDTCRGYSDTGFMD